MTDKSLVIHFDLDSPNSLLQFWGADAPPVDLEPFFEAALTRALEMLDGLGFHAAFFCVGRELEGSPNARRLLAEAHAGGHELGNHTYSHPYGLTRLTGDEQLREIRECSRVIREVTGEAPMGFRSPGYDINTALMNVLEREGFAYDSSAFWSIFNPMFRAYHRWFSSANTYNGLVQSSRRLPQRPYFPSADAWSVPGAARTILELPLPRVGALGLPFYNNFSLTVGQQVSRYLASAADHQHLVYLFHLIEFVDMSDGMPSALKRHPNIQVRTSEKLRQMKATLSQLGQKYDVQRTVDHVAHARRSLTAAAH